MEIKGDMTKMRKQGIAINKKRTKIKTWKIDKEMKDKDKDIDIDENR